MIRELYLNEDFCAVAEDGKLTEYIPEDASENAGEILLGRAERMMPGMNSAFIGIGRSRSGYLPLAEASRSFTGSQLKSGDSVIVQIKKEEFGEKGAYLTRDISLPGKTVLLMPMNRHIGVSGRIQDEDEKQRLRELGKTLSGGAFGLVMRAASADAEADEIQKEIRMLQEEWQRILREASSAAPPKVLRQQTGHAEQLINDYAARGGISRIRRNEPLTADLERQLREAGLRRIQLCHGGNIVIDRCEAMTVIDVNSAGDTAGSDQQEVFLQTNLEACDEIARQVRLRNLSGIVIIDFINVKTDPVREQILEKLRQGFESDRVKTVIHGFTSLGLAEITRKRSRPDWYEQHTETCPECGGSGRIRKNGGKA